MSGLLPRIVSPRTALKPGLPPAAALDRYDAILVLLPTDAAPDRRLPFRATWEAMHRRGKIAHGTVRAATLDNPRQSLAVAAYCRDDADAFERLRVAGLAVQKLLGERPQPVRLALVAQIAPRNRAQWQEALAAAVLAQSFALPSAKRATTAPKTLAAIDIFGESTLDLRRLTITADATNLVRHLVALPPNQLDAAGYRRLLAQLARRYGLRLRWYDEKALTRMGAGAFLAVSRGNARRDAGIAHLSWVPPRGKRSRQRPDIALVGKGVLFDTGGTNLKPHRSMLDMHTDMAGSAVALAGIIALARLKAPWSVDAWLAITENSIGPAAYRPQEIVRALDGTTIQIIHTDAEGRLILADTLALAARRKPGLLVDFATLTGACIYALTERMSGAFSNDDALLDALVAAGRASGERIWPFPMPEDFDTDIESTVADVAQCSLDGKGDHILATRFLQRFVPRPIRWAHVDLSAATRRGGLAHVSTEITGFGARVLLNLLLDQKPRR